MTDAAILTLAYLTAFTLSLVVLGMIAEVVMILGARRRSGGAIFKMAETAARGARPPRNYSEARLMALSPAGPLAKDIAKCQRCGAEIVFLQSFNQRTKKRGRMPVNLRPTTPKFRPPNAGEVDYKHGEHESHFATCEDNEYFKGRRK